MACIPAVQSFPFVRAYTYVGATTTGLLAHESPWVIDLVSRPDGVYTGYEYNYLLFQADAVDDSYWGTLCIYIVLSGPVSAGNTGILLRPGGTKPWAVPLIVTKGTVVASYGSWVVSCAIP